MGGDGGGWPFPDVSGAVGTGSSRGSVCVPFASRCNRNLWIIRSFGVLMIAIQWGQKMVLKRCTGPKPWYTAELATEKQLRRKCERKYKNTQLESDKLLLKEQRNKYNNLLNSTKKDYIKNKIENAQSSKDLYKICDKLLNREQRSVLPSHDCATSLANTFVDYFKNKIELIRSNLEESLNTSTDQLPSTAPIFHGLSLEQLRELSLNLMSGK